MDTSVKKKVEEIMPIATGHELEELAAEVQVTFRNLYFLSDADAIAISEAK